MNWVGNPQYQQPSLEVLVEGLILPLTRLSYTDGIVDGTFDGGTYDSSGQVCKLGLQIKEGYRNSPIPFDPSGACDHLDGAYIFGGLLQNEHFGHFMAESLSRLWAVAQLGSHYEGIAFYKRHPDLPVASFVTETLAAILPGVPIRIVERPTRIAVLAVPSQLAHVSNGVIYGHDLAKRMFAPVRRRRDDLPRRIYVSRSHLSGSKGAIIAEHAIETNLRAEGYDVVFPETLRIKDQFSLYHSADDLVFADGSAMHMYALVPRPEQKLFAIWRRNPHWSFGWQVKTFGGSAIHGRPCVEKHFVPVRDGTNKVRAKALLNYADLRAQLVEHGFIEGNAWVNPSDSEVSAEIAALTDVVEVAF